MYKYMLKLDAQLQQIVYFLIYVQLFTLFTKRTLMHEHSDILYCYEVNNIS